MGQEFQTQLVDYGRGDDGRETRGPRRVESIEVSQIFASWNQMTHWLLEWDALRLAASMPDARQLG